jgi:hypothetical protein
LHDGYRLRSLGAEKPLSKKLNRLCSTNQIDIPRVALAQQWAALLIEKQTATICGPLLQSRGSMMVT